MPGQTGTNLLLPTKDAERVYEHRRTAEMSRPGSDSLCVKPLNRLHLFQKLLQRLELHHRADSLVLTNQTEGIINVANVIAS